MRTARLLPVSPWSRGVYLVGGVYLVWGVYLVPGVYLPRYPPPNRMTNRYKNITLPQTSFAGGNNL